MSWIVPFNSAFYIRAAMRRIEDMSTEPRSVQQYVDLCRQLNAAQSALRALPDEVLSLILEHASRPGDDKDLLLHLPLRLVCSRWCSIARSTPQLWTSVDSGRHDDIARFGQYLKLCIDNSGSLPLTITLRFYEESDPQILVSPTVDDALRCNLYRIKSLTVAAAPTTWLDIIPSMLQLTSLFLFLSKDDVPEAAKSGTMDLAMLSRLETLSLSSPCMYDINLGPAALSITQLELMDTPIDICIRLYLMCPNLVDFRCHESQVPPRSTSVPEVPAFLLKRESLTLLSLELLTGNLSHWNDYILKWTQFPALETLWWTDESLPTSHYNATVFFQRISKSLTTIRFSAITASAGDTESLIQHICHNCNISLIDLVDCNAVFLNNVVRVLYGETAANGDKIIRFPKLLHLSFDIRDEEERPDLICDLGVKIAQMLEERKEIIREFTIESTHDFDEWEDETWDRLEELVRGGLKLSIFQPSSGIWPDPDDMASILEPLSD